MSESRNEELLQDIIDESSTEMKPQSRVETILKAIIDGTDSSELPKAQSRNEALLLEVLDKINEGGSDVDVEPLSVDANGTYTAPSGTAYSPVTVDVPTGAEVEPLSVTQNGTYTAPTGSAYSPVTVNVSGGPVSVPAEAVNFRDYDGTIVYSYTPAEFAALTAMPDNPDHSGDEIPLTSQGWNWSFADARAYVAKYGRLEIGQMYVPTDGKTHVLIHLEEGRTSPMLGVCPNGTVDVDWGDGTAHSTLTGTSTSTVKWTPTHNYAAPGDYDIKLTCTGTMAFSGVSNNWAYILRNAIQANVANRHYLCAVKSVFCANNVIIGPYAFYECNGLKQITIPNGATALNTDAFDECCSLVSVVIPSSVTSIGSYAFMKCYNAISIMVPSGVTVMSSSAFSSCYNLSRIVIPDGVSNLSTSFVGAVYGISFIAIPSSVTNIAANAFSTCSGMAEYHFYRTTPPTLANTSAFNGIPSDCIIYVPYSEDHSILNAYKTATNWSTYASRMQEEPQ